MEDGPRAALEAAIAGDPGAARALLDDPGARAGDRLALRAQLARMAPERWALPSLDEIEALRGPERAAGAIAAATIAREAVSRLDGPAIVRAAEVASALASAARSGGSGDARAVLEAESASAWAALARGAQGGLRETARALESRASKERLAHLVIDAASLGALAALAEDDLEGAIAVARRASRMARTESLPQEEYLAHGVLARVRRHAGRPHLATRILAALSRVAPASWRGWLALELVLAGARDVAARTLAGAGSHGAGPAADAAEALERAITSASRGDRDAFDLATADARAAARRFAPLAPEIDALACALDPRAPAIDRIASFLGGASDALPPGVAGVASIPRAGEAHALVRVIAAPGRAPRRVLAAGLPLAGGAVEIGREAGAKQHRREAALAILALAGPGGIAKEDLFRAIWGFAFVAHLHQGVLDVLLHRVRAALGSAADLVRRESRVALELRAEIAIADPRAEQPLDDRVLSLVGARGGAAARARELAQELDVPLRTVQGALSRLVDEGDCVREGEGQQVAYRVEDTTFREPTLI